MLQGESHSRRKAPLAYTLDLEPMPAAPASPCDGCRNFERCKSERICCEAFVLFDTLKDGQHTAERWRLAPRFPSRAILERLTSSPPRPSEVERRRAREALAVKMQREAAEF
jgi:hypothetical protein